MSSSLLDQHIKSRKIIEELKSKIWNPSDCEKTGSLKMPSMSKIKKLNKIQNEKKKKHKEKKSTKEKIKQLKMEIEKIKKEAKRKEDNKLIILDSEDSDNENNDIACQGPSSKSDGKRKQRRHSVKDNENNQLKFKKNCNNRDEKMEQPNADAVNRFCNVCKAIFPIKNWNEHEESLEHKKCSVRQKMTFISGYTWQAGGSKGEKIPEKNSSMKNKDKDEDQMELKITYELKKMKRKQYLSRMKNISLVDGSW